MPARPLDRSSPLPLWAQLEVELLDADGAPLDAATAAVGLAVPASALREQDRFITNDPWVARDIHAHRCRRS